MLIPKFFTTLRETTPRQLAADCVSGVIVGVVALPLAIAFAIASGVAPERGLVTAIVAGFLISFLGGSRVQIGGPTGAFVVIVYAIVQRHGMDGLILATLMGGVILMIMGFARFGSVIKFIPYPIVVGFTSGIALIIFSSQINDFLGLGAEHVPAEFIQKWGIYFARLDHVNFYAAAAAAATVAIVILWRRVSKTIPGSLIALIVVTWTAHHFKLPIETIGSRFGEVPHTLPPPVLPHGTLEKVCELLPSAVTIAILAGIESLLSAVVSDAMIGGKHRSNMELVAQGVANVASALFGGMPATGAIARTSTNVHNGGRTPVAGIVHALTLLAILFFLGKWVVLVPMAYLAGVLVVVAYHMCEWRSFAMVLKSPRGDVLVLLVTFGLTVLADLTLAIEVGMVMAAFLFMNEAASVADTGIAIRDFAESDEDAGPGELIRAKDLPPGVEVYEVNGPLFFAVAHKFSEALRAEGRRPKAQIIRMRNCAMIDASGIRALKDEWSGAKKRGTILILSEAPPKTLEALRKAELREKIGAENIVDTYPAALDRARALVGRV